MADYGGDKKSGDGQMRAAINQQLVETGEREKLKELLRNRLTECGWRDQLKELCKVGTPLGQLLTHCLAL